METSGNETDVQAEATVTAEATTTPQAPTAEEQMKALKAELDTAKAERQKSEDSYKGLQRTLNKTSEELKRQADLRGEIDSLKETQKILAAMLQETKAVPEENLENIPQGKKQDYLKQFEEAEKRIALKRQQEELVNKARDFQARTEALGLKPDDERYVEIEELVETGRFKTADAKIKKMEQEKTTVTEAPKPTETPKETEDQMKARIEMEILKKHGLLKTETGTPSGGNLTEQKVRQDFIQGKTSVEKYAEQCRSLGISPN